MPSEFVFVPTPYSAELQEELAKALRARTEIISRKMNPKLWRMTDGVNRFAEANRADDPVLKRRKTVQTVLSVVLAAMGVFLLVTGLTEPRNTTLLAAGAIALVIAAARLLPRPDTSMTRQFQRSASLLLKSLGGMDLSSKPKIRFTDEAMQIKTNQKSADFPYEKNGNAGGNTEPFPADALRLGHGPAKEGSDFRHAGGISGLFPCPRSLPLCKID